MVSLISGQGYFTFQNTTYTTERVEEKKTQTRTWVNSKRKKEAYDTFLAFCELSRACIRAKFPQSHKEHWLGLSRWPTRISVHRFLLLLSSDDCPVLSTGLFCLLLLLFCHPHPLSSSGTLLPSSSSDLVGNLTCKPFVRVSRQNKQRNLLTDTYLHNECPHRITRDKHLNLAREEEKMEH